MIFHLNNFAVSFNLDHTPTERNSRKLNINDIPEDTSIDSAFAKTLDRSCFVEPRVMPPEIENAVVRNLRRQKEGRIFPVAVYTCDEDYELENEDNDRLYCSKRKWIGTHPNCMQLEENYGENGEDEEDDEVLLHLALSIRLSETLSVYH
ncbi:hypothetical protein Bhyg_05807 [Pseudolycoriella hygida]|uniref:Sushi domain-containing protein n=1 Tax=Pseudolycoriella hygida TaxID=35572 RepID=A0A9Q0S1D5_9DIPT|nr:hypothetical protein Bhyg_05807 [Pseudolycoriella hygida]